jgi:Zn-dependent protease with chaperone function
MAVHGYVTHAASNRRFTALLVLGYVLAFELIGAFALILPLLIFDQEHTILSNPLGYALRYALPLGAVSALLFWQLYRGHAKAVARSLHITMVSRQDEPRFVAIAERACTTLGVRCPRFGVIEYAEPNAVTVGEGPARGLIAVTRGLLDQLDDDELAAVLAHEASHIRQGDTKVLAANHALMRTAVMLQTHNPLRIEDWRQMIIPLALPPMLLIMLASGATMMASMQLARTARRGIKLGRDHIADGEAIRVTHFPEALIDALNKIGGKGAFPGSWRVEGLLFDGPADHEGGTHPAVRDRLTAIATLGRDLISPGRLRADTRQPSRPRFGQQRKPGHSQFQYDSEGRPIGPMPQRSLHMLLQFFTDRDAFREWQSASIAWFEWRVSDRRNALGLKPMMVIPVAAVTAFLIVFHWPADGDMSKLAAKFGPGGMVDIAREVNSGPFCSGPSYPDGKCLGQEDKTDRTVSGSSGFAAITAKQSAAVNGDPFHAISAPREGSDGAPSPWLGMIGILPMLLIAINAVRPQWLRWLVAPPGSAPMQATSVRPAAPIRPPEPEPERAAQPPSAYDDFDRKVQARLQDLQGAQPRPAPMPPAVATFGRKRV